MEYKNCPRCGNDLGKKSGLIYCNGCGFAPQNSRRDFDPYYNGDGRKRNFDGHVVPSVDFDETER
jgi:hypothetical protein